MFHTVAFASSASAVCRAGPGAVALLVAVALMGGAAPAQAGGKGKATTTTSRSAASSGAGGDATVAGEVLLKLDAPHRLPDLLVRHQLSLMAGMGARPIYRVKVLAGASVDQVVGALALEPGVLLAEPNRLYAGPEPAKNNVWAVGTAQAYATQWAPAAMRLPQAWTVSAGHGQRVAVLDTGVDRTHPLLAGRLLPGRDFVDGDDDPSEAGDPTQPAWGHGTHVAGLVALAAPGARVMPLRVLDARGTGHAWALAEAMLYAGDPDGDPATDDGAHVINLSLAGPQRTRLLDTVALLASCSTPPADDPAGEFSDSGYNDDRRRCEARPGAIVVAAAGNDGSRDLQAYPAAEKAYGLLAVAASNARGRVAEFSNSGNWIQLAAPGDAITSSVPGGWGTWSGTSMAAPLVSGVAALLRAAAPGLAATDVARCLERTAAPLSGAPFGQVDAWAVLQALGSRKLCR